MKFAETPISTQNTVYLKDEIRQALKVETGDILEWHIVDQRVEVRKRVS